MIITWSQYYRSPSPAPSWCQPSNLSDIKPIVSPGEAFQHSLAWRIDNWSHVCPRCSRRGFNEGDWKTFTAAIEVWEEQSWMENRLLSILKMFFSKREKVLEIKIGALEGKLKNFAWYGQMLDLLTPSKGKASSSTIIICWRLRGEVIDAAGVTHPQFVSRATYMITKEYVESLLAWDNGPADHIHQVRLSIFLGLADDVQTGNGCDSSTEVANLATDRVNSLAVKVLHKPLFITMDWSSPCIQHAKVFHLACRIYKKMQHCHLWPWLRPPRTCLP